VDNLFKDILELYGIDIENASMENFLEVIKAAGLEIVQSEDGSISVVPIDSYDKIIEEVSALEETETNNNQIESVFNGEFFESGKLDAQSPQLFKNSFLNSIDDVDLSGLDLEEILSLIEEYEKIDLNSQNLSSVEIQPITHRIETIRIEKAEKIKREEEQRYIDKEAAKLIAEAELKSLEIDAVLMEASESFNLDNSVAAIEVSKDIIEDVKEVETKVQIEEGFKNTAPTSGGAYEEISDWFKIQSEKLNSLIDSFKNKVLNESLAF